MPYLLIVCLQIFCVIHVVRTGREQIWIYVLILLPGAGVLAYVIAELLPGWLGGHRARGLKSGAIKTLDPGRTLRHRMNALEDADTIENRRLVAEELTRLGRFDEAAEAYRSGLVGIHADDPSLLLGFARASYGANHPETALAALDQLRAADPKFQSAEAHLLYAKSLEALGRDSEAAEEYDHLVGYAPGEEVRCRYALLLQRTGRSEAAQSLFGEILSRTRRAPSRYRRAEREWIDTARRAAG